MRRCIKWGIEDNPRLLSIQMANTNLTDEWFAELLPLIEQNSKMLTELMLDSNPIGDKTFGLLGEYISSNPPCLRVLRVCNLFDDISTLMMEQFLPLLEKNTQLIKISIDTRLIQHKDRINRVCDRNWKRYAQERRLKRTLLTQIKNMPSKVRDIGGGSRNQKNKIGGRNTKNRQNDVKKRRKIVNT